jgi:hypothetical protein
MRGAGQQRGRQSALPALRQAAADPEPLISMHAGWAIRQIERQKTAHCLLGD